MNLFGLVLITLTLKEFDQIKLGELMGRMPDTVALKTTIEVPGPIPATETQITYPVQPQGFQIYCAKTYYNGSPYPSSSVCSVTIDPAHPNFTQSYDEIRFSVIDPSLVQTMFQAIPYGETFKEYYSWEKNAGTNYEGRRADIFHYRFECTMESCLIRFSDISVN